MKLQIDDKVVFSLPEKHRGEPAGTVLGIYNDFVIVLLETPDTFGNKAATYHFSVLEKVENGTSTQG